MLAGNQSIFKSVTVSKVKPPCYSLPKFVDEDAQMMEFRSKQEKERKKSLENYRKLLKKIDKLFIKVSEIIESLKSLSVWSDPGTSLNVTLSLLVMAISMLWVSVSTLFLLLMLIFFCCNVHFVNRTTTILVKVKDDFLGLPEQISKTHLPTAISQSFVTQRLRQNQVVLETSVQPSSTDELNSSGDGGNSNDRNIKKDKGMVVFILTACCNVCQGNCFKCGVSFNRLLKWRVSCFIKLCY
jgi:hypothetical protein